MAWIGVAPKGHHGIVLQGEQGVAAAAFGALSQQRTLQGVRLVVTDSSEPAVLKLHAQSVASRTPFASQPVPLYNAASARHVGTQLEDECMFKLRVATALLTAGIISGSSLGFLPTGQVSIANAAGGGPVVLDGTDSGLHGSAVGGVPQGAWLYMQKGIEALYAALPSGYAAADNGKIAVVGAADSTATSNNCGGAAHYIAATLGKTADFFEGEPAIAGLLTELAAGTNKYSVLWLVEQNWCGNGMSNAEAAALTANSAAIAAHVNRGGALFAQSQSYGWLSALFPTLSSNSGSGSTPIFTTEGSALFGGIASSNIANPWHSYFTDSTGTLPLGVLAYQSGTQAVIIGGASVTLPSAVAITVAPFAEVGDEVCAEVLVKEPISGVLTPKAGAAVAWAVSGAHTRTGSGTTNADGEATYCYTGTVAGTDTVTVTFEDASAEGVVLWRQMPTTAGGKIVVPAPATTVAPVASNFATTPETLSLTSDFVDLLPVADVTAVGDISFSDKQFGETTILLSSTIQFSTDFFSAGDCLAGYFQLPDGTWIDLGDGIKPGTELVLDPIQFKSLGRYEIDLTTTVCAGSASRRLAAELQDKPLALYGMSNVGRALAAAVTPDFGALTSRYVINVVTTLPSTNQDGNFTLILVVMVAALTTVAGVKLVRGTEYQD